MTPTSTTATCRRCGARLAPNRAKCRHCGAWNTGAAETGTPGVADGTVLLSDVEAVPVPRIRTGPWDVHFGDPPGIPDDSVSLIGGEPGVGKSTLGLQWAGALATATDGEVLYLAAEENRTQIRDRGVRLGIPLSKLRIWPMEAMGHALLDTVLAHHPIKAVVIDSISMYTDSPEDAVDKCKAFKQNYAIVHRLPFLVIDHVTKDGDMAGLMKLQHAVDITLIAEVDDVDVLYPCHCPTGVLDWEPQSDDHPGLWTYRPGNPWTGNVSGLRQIKTIKTRYGPSGAKTAYCMTSTGLVAVRLLDTGNGNEGSDDDG